ncbi:MAG: isopentenyl phosphate kinase [Promethearchaeota archaeon]
MDRTLTVIKLGGALLTEKNKPYTTQKVVIPAIVQEIYKCRALGLIEDLIVIHGVGSHGHPPVLAYRLHHGFKDPTQLLALTTTQQAVNAFRMELVSEFIKVGIPVNLMHISSFCVSSKSSIKEMFLESFNGFLSLGMIPLVGGDMVYDRTMGFSVGGGDQLAVMLAKKLPVTRLIFATDVDGIYSDDPKKNPDAKLLSGITCGELSERITATNLSEKKDASGAMKGKLIAIQALEDQIKAGLEVSLLSMRISGNLIDLLTHKLKTYTRFLP